MSPPLSSTVFSQLLSYRSNAFYFLVRFKYVSRFLIWTANAISRAESTRSSAHKTMSALSPVCSERTTAGPPFPESAGAVGVPWGFPFCNRKISRNLPVIIYKGQRVDPGRQCSISFLLSSVCCDIMAAISLGKSIKPILCRLWYFCCEIITETKKFFVISKNNYKS